MSLDALSDQIDGYRSKAANLLDSYAATQADIAADPNLTEIGKTEALQPFHEDVAAKVRALLTEEKAAVTRKRESLEKTVFGITAANTTDITSYRDAQDRSESLTDPDEAWSKYTNALRSDDKILAQAILGRALELGWPRITADYRSRNPSAATALDDLANLTRYENNSFLSLTHYIVPGLSTGLNTAAPIRTR